MSAEMTGLEGGREEDAPTGISETFEEIDVLEPEGEEAFVEATGVGPGGVTDEDAGAGGLDIISGLEGVEVEGAVVAVDRVRGEETVETEGFEEEGGGGWEAAELEAGLGLAGRREEAAGGGGGVRIGLEESGEDGGGGGEGGIGVEEEDGIGGGEVGEALVGGGGEAEVFGVGDEVDTGAGADFVEGGVGGMIVHDDEAGGEGMGEGEAGVEAGADVAGGVIGNDDGAGCHEATRK
jgi:hypothetical protein